MSNVIRVVVLSLAFHLLFSCSFSSGKLGGFDRISFPVSKRKMDLAIDSLVKQHPDYSIPEKWKEFDSWEERGFGFMQSIIFYFKEKPEEMYYVTYLGNLDEHPDTTETRIAVRAVNYGQAYWYKHDDLSKRDQEKIAARFNREIVEKLEGYLQVESHIVKDW